MFSDNYSNVLQTKVLIDSIRKMSAKDLLEIFTKIITLTEIIRLCYCNVLKKADGKPIESVSVTSYELPLESQFDLEVIKRNFEIQDRGTRISIIGFTFDSLLNQYKLLQLNTSENVKIIFKEDGKSEYLSALISQSFYL